MHTLCMCTYALCVSACAFFFDGVNGEAIYKLRKRLPLQKSGRV